MASIVVEAVSLIGVFIACGIAYALGYKQGMDTMSRIDNRIIEEAVNEIYGKERDYERNPGKKDCNQHRRHQQESWQDCDIPAEDSGDESGPVADGIDSAWRAGESAEDNGDNNGRTGGKGR